MTRLIVLISLKGKFISAITDILVYIANAFKELFKDVLTSLEEIVLNTPYPKAEGDGSFGTDAAFISPKNVKDGNPFDQPDLFFEVQAIAIMLLVIAAVIAYSSKIYEKIPFFNSQPDLGRIFFAFVIVLLWWTVMTGSLVLTDTLAGVMANSADSLSEMGDDVGGNELTANTTSTSSDGGADQRQSTITTALVMIVVYFLNFTTILILLILWALRFVLVVGLGIAGPIFVALKAYEDLGIPYMAKFGKKGLNLFFTLAALPIPAALFILIADPMIAAAADVAGGSSLGGQLLTSILRAAIPIVAVAIPFYFMKRDSGLAGSLYGRVEKGTKDAAKAGKSAAVGTVAAGSAYAQSNKGSRAGRLGDAIDESGSEFFNRQAKRARDTQDAVRASQGKEATKDERFGRDGDAGGRSSAYNMFDTATAAGTGRQLDAEEIAEGADFEGTEYEGIELDADEVREQYDLSEGDTVTGARRREIRQELAEQKKKEQAIEDEDRNIADVGDLTAKEIEAQQRVEEFGEQSASEMAERYSISEESAAELKADLTEKGARVDSASESLGSNTGDIANKINQINPDTDFSETELADRIDEIDSMDSVREKSDEYQKLVREITSEANAGYFAGMETDEISNTLENTVESVQQKALTAAKSDDIGQEIEELENILQSGEVSQQLQHLDENMEEKISQIQRKTEKGSEERLSQYADLLDGMESKTEEVATSQSRTYDQLIEEVNDAVDVDEAEMNRRTEQVAKHLAEYGVDEETDLAKSVGDALAATIDKPDDSNGPNGGPNGGPNYYDFDDPDGPPQPPGAGADRNPVAEDETTLEDMANDNIDDGSADDDDDSGDPWDLINEDG